MQSNQNPVIDKNELADAVAQDLTELQKTVPHVKSLAGLKDFAWPQATADLVREAAGRLRKLWEEAKQQHEARINERTEGLIEALDRRQQWLESLVERRRSEIQKPAEGKLAVAGRVMDKKTNVGLPDVRVNVFDADRRFDDRLGDTRTDELGYYRMEYAQADLEKLFETSPVVRVEVLDEQGEPLYSSPKGFVLKAGEVRGIDASVDGDKLPASLKLSKAVARGLAERIEEYEQRKQLLRDRNLAGFGP